MPASILSIGIDQELLPLRNLVLRQVGGYAVQQQSDLSRVLRVFMDGDFDLVILCHSIPANERQRIASAIKAARPSTLVLVVRADGEATGVADGSVHSLDGPEVLLQSVRELLSRPKRS
jgi:DNA-binding response OmpR family regulator